MEQGELQQDSRHCSPKCAKAVLSECGEYTFAILLGMGGSRFLSTLNS